MDEQNYLKQDDLLIQLSHRSQKVGRCVLTNLHDLLTGYTISQYTHKPSSYTGLKKSSVFIYLLFIINNYWFCTIAFYSEPTRLSYAGIYKAVLALTVDIWVQPDIDERW